LCPANGTSQDILSSTGAYIKTACIIKSPMIAYDAQIFCSDNNMKMFSIESTDTQTGLFSFLKSSGTQTNFWLNGERELEFKFWYYFSYREDPVRAFNGLTWVSNSNTAVGKDCLMAILQGTTFMVDGTACSSVYWPVCEFRKT
jgi:hypothetical protein